mmetsp:Transcript_15948/g.35494  ORF Transcript_15948/g.35494 Transcript_15948/m.35494 type:complete len:490 (+) Transcript_15948:124-1593(+)
MSESISSEMSSKRLKTAEASEVSTSGGDSKEAPNVMILPDDVWPKVLLCLDHQSILRCCAVCRTFLHSSVPQLPRVVLDRPKQLDAATIRRFKGVETVEILCFIRTSIVPIRSAGFSDREHSFNIVDETCWRLPSFLACIPKSVKNVYLAGKLIRTDGVVLNMCCTNRHFEPPDPTIENRKNWKYVWLHPECYRHSTPHNYSLLGQLVMSICAAYRNGSIPQTMTLWGLFESDERLDNISAYYHLHEGTTGAACQFCHGLCTSLPVSQVMQLTCALTPSEEFVFEASAHENVPAAHSICLTAHQLLEIVSSRSGGRREIEKFFDEVYHPNPKECSGVFKNCFYHLLRTFNYFPCNEKGYPTTLARSLLNSRTYATAFATDLRMIAIIETLMSDYGFKPPKLSEEYATSGVYECSIFEEFCTRDTWEDKCTSDEKKAFITRSTFEALVRIGFPLRRTPFILFDDENAIARNDDLITNDDVEDVFYAFTRF